MLKLKLVNELHASIKKSVCTRVEFKLQNEEYNSVTTLVTTSWNYSAHTWNGIFTSKCGKDSSFRGQSKTVEILAQIRLYSSLQGQHPVEKVHSQITRCKPWQTTLGSTCETSQEHSKHYELWLYQNPVGQSEQNRLWIKMNFDHVNLVQPHTRQRMSDKHTEEQCVQG